MMNFNKIISLFPATTLMAATVACSDDETLKTPLPTSTGNLENASFYTLSFKWDKVDGALQYSYQLTDENEHIVATDVTQLTTVTFDNLQPSTDYTLTVLAYAAVGGPMTTSEPLVLHGRTSDIIVLATPQPTYIPEGNTVTVSWPAVDNAENYTYTLSIAESEVTSGTTSDCTVSFKNLETAEYTFAVTANVDRLGYADSETASITFEFERIHNELWSCEGTFTSSVLDKSWTATIVAYDDNTYTLKAWYGVEGYDLNFEINTSDADNMFILSATEYSYDAGSDSYAVPTGLSSPKTLYVAASDNYSWMTGTSKAGDIGLLVYNNSAGDWTEDRFAWRSNKIHLAGTWTMTVKGITEITDDWSAESYEYTDTYTITQIDANTFEFPALYCDDETMTVTVDWEAGTLTVQPTDVWSWYVLAGTSATTPITGTINADGSLTFTDWKVYYDGWPYVYDSVATFTR